LDFINAIKKYRTLVNAMKYLCVVEYFFGVTPGGSGRVAWDIAQAMRDRGHSVTLLCYQSGDEEEGAVDYAGIRIVRFKKKILPIWHPSRLKAIIDSTASACRRWLGDGHWDVVHVHSPLMGLGVVSALGRTPRYISTVHSPVVMEQEIIWRHQGLIGRMKLLFGRKVLANAEARMLNSASAIHTLSEFTRNKIDEAYGVGQRVTVIPHWYQKLTADIDKRAARKALGWPDEATVFFTVRGLQPRYGLDTAISALAPLVRDQKCYFYIGGIGPLRQSLENLASRLGGGERIRFMGRLSDTDLELAYSAADMFILPTLALECFGLIMIEAFSFGCPVIATDAGAIPELMQPILPDCIVPAGDAEALREKARQFMEHRINLPERNKLIEYAEVHYNQSAIMSRFMELFLPPTSPAFLNRN
jgi:glycosyltransferase involved in cell wall biosynthesis